MSAKLIGQYGNTDAVVLSLSDHGVAVGYQLASNLHVSLRRLLMETIHIDDESIDYATVLPGGVISISHELTDAERQYYYGEYSGMLEQAIRQAQRRIDGAMDIDEISPEDMRGHTVILTDDGINNATALEAAVDWLKPVHVAKLVLACPVISVAALDKAHVLMDELTVLSVTPNYFNTTHYYDEDDAPDDEMVLRMLTAANLA